MTAGRARLPVLIAALAAIAVALATVAGRLPGAPHAAPSTVLALVPLLGLAALLGLDFRVGGGGDRLDLFDAALAVALLSAPGPAVLGCVALAKVATLAAQRFPPVKIWFNTAQWGVAAAAGSLVVAALRPFGPPTLRDLVVLLAALPVVAVLNATAVLLVLTAAGGRPPLRPTARGLLRGTAVSGLANLVLGVLAAALWLRPPAGLLALPVVLLTAHLAARLWTQRRVGASRLAGLQRIAAVLAGPDVLPAAAPRFLAELQHACLPERGPGAAPRSAAGARARTDLLGSGRRRATRRAPGGGAAAPRAGRAAGASRR